MKPNPALASGIGWCRVSQVLLGGPDQIRTGIAWVIILAGYLYLHRPRSDSAYFAVCTKITPPKYGELSCITLESYDPPGYFHSIITAKSRQVDKLINGQTRLFPLSYFRLWFPNHASEISVLSPISITENRPYRIGCLRLRARCRAGR